MIGQHALVEIEVRAYVQLPLKKQDLVGRPRQKHQVAQKNPAIIHKMKVRFNPEQFKMKKLIKILSRDDSKNSQ